MANVPDRPAATAEPSLLEKLTAKRQVVAYVLLGLALVGAILLLVFLIQGGRSAGGALGVVRHPAFYWGLACTATLLVVGLLTLAIRPDGPTAATEQMRIHLLVLGGVLGLLTTILGYLLPFTEYWDIFAGGVKEWRKYPWPLVWTGLSMFGGLFLMFLTVQLTRGMERASAGMRRLQYGYNTALTTLLLLDVLVLINVVAYVGPFQSAFGHTFDWTSRSLYTLSDKSKAILRDLKKPVRVVVLLRQDDPITHDVTTLLENARAITPELTWELLSPERNRRAVAELLDKYPVQEPYGLLVLSGTEPNIQWDFIKEADLSIRPGGLPMQQQSQKYTFEGENALMKSIVYLSQGKARAIVYFTQGNGEMDPEDRTNPQGLGVLRERLEKANYDVRKLDLGAGGKDRVPADADLVVVAAPGGPGAPMIPTAVTALRNYIAGTGGKKGKLLVMLEARTQRGGAGGMVPSGLEGLLGEYGVDVPASLVLNLMQPDPTEVLAIANPNSSNPVARSFTQGGMAVPFGFVGVREVKPRQAPPGGARQVETLVQTVRQTVPIVDTELTTPPVALANSLRKRENIEKLRQMVAKTPVSLGVAVSEGSAPQMPPGHPAVAGNTKPLMAVFGDASWVSNEAWVGRDTGLLRKTHYNNYDLFVSCLSWLRERPDIGRQVEGKEREEYTMTLPATTVRRIQMLPLGLMLLSVLALAGGIWVVRRR